MRRPFPYAQNNDMANQHNFKFTPEAEALLRELYPDHTAEECAAAIGCGRNTVNGRALKLGLKKSPEYIAAHPAVRQLTPEEERRIVDYYPGHTHKEIAEHVGCAPDTVSRVVKKYGLARSPEFLAAHKHGAKDYTAGLGGDAAICAKLWNTHTIAQIGKRLGEAGHFCAYTMWVARKAGLPFEGEKAKERDMYLRRWEKAQDEMARNPADFTPHYCKGWKGSGHIAPYSPPPAAAGCNKPLY